MERQKQMDRLVCGDAGFGKTEVAMRAAFKAINNGSRALMLTSTTLLAQQHFTVFKERMADYPVNIEMISRLVSAKKRKEIISNLKEGKVDILIGTHAVLSQDIEIPDMGLVIIDEEQHFGVKAKESLRKKYPEADILTLTATPIPRTLYFSLSGIRDISMINTPPVGKKPIETYIVEEKLNTAKEIILREILRHGQVFYVHNNIRTITKVKEVLEQNLPEVKFRTAHGRMPKQELEKIMLDFLARKFDVLITTTIIEAGLDMPDVNTIIISSAENFGLGQLYQLRGRVGRRDRQAYAYLMVHDRRAMSGVAEERLKTIESYVDPGAGFRIAMKDLELRGAGNILGIKQHGNMEKIGFELYCRMLEEAVAKMKGEEIENEVDTKIKVGLMAFIPESYIWDSAEKLRIYRRLFLARELEDIKKISADLRDIWGEYPEEVKNILFVGKLKAIGRKLKASEISEKEGKLVFLWRDKKEIDQAKFQRFAAKYRPHVKFSGNMMEMEFKDDKQIMDMMMELL
jgi:transcription-repair coupling factor (superfamily II helicase)